ncbi:hypothetical protein D3C86_2133490 [compost metagenome]
MYIAELFGLLIVGLKRNLIVVHDDDKFFCPVFLSIEIIKQVTQITLAVRAGDNGNSLLV